MAAFAADETDEPFPPAPIPPTKLRTTQIKQALHSLSELQHRPASAPTPDIPDSSPFGQSEFLHPTPNLPTSTPVSDITIQTPHRIRSLSPIRSYAVMPSANRGKHRSPVRYPLSSATTSPSNFVPTSTTFYPNIPNEARKVLHNANGGMGVVVSQNGAVGAKRPMIEVEMGGEEPVTPVRPLGRAAKRRMRVEDGEEKEKEKEKSGRRSGRR